LRLAISRYSALSKTADASAKAESINPFTRSKPFSIPKWLYAFFPFFKQPHSAAAFQ
jgi:hypothetical protein